MEPLDLLRAIRELKPAVVHFSGHGGARGPGASGSAHGRDVAAASVPAGAPLDGLYFHDAVGGAQVVSPEAIAQTFGAAGASVKLVVLNACYSEPIAEALIEHVGCVVGMSGSIHDDAARSFAIGFYGGLGEGESVAAACAQGKVAISLAGLPDAERPRLKVRDGLDATQVVFAADHLERSPGDVQVRAEAQRDQRRSTIESTMGEPQFTGRDAELGAIHDKLQAGRVVVLYGAPGLGKSRLAREYARRHVEAYPGGMFLFPFDQPPPIELAKLLRGTGRPAYPDESVGDQCRRALGTLGTAGRVLLIYDAIADERTLRDWRPYEGLDWHVIVTSTSARWASTWSSVHLGPLPPDAARGLAASILGNEAPSEQLADRIAANAGGITIELCASAATERERLRRGRTADRISADPAGETTSSFGSAWTLLSPEAQLVLRVASTFATPRVRESIVSSALQRTGWTPSAVEDAIDDVCDRMLAGRDNETLALHQLVAQFVRARAPLGKQVQRSLFAGLLATADLFHKHPADLDLRALMLTHSLRVADWAAVVTEDSEWLVVGYAIAELGRFEEARRWFEHAVAAAEQGDVHGRVDSQRLGASLHQVGYCYSSLGQFTEARKWFERAVAVAEQGDVRGRVDSDSLGTSLHQVGYCHASLGQFAEARPWFERAVAAKEQGDVRGQVDSQNLGRSLHQVGDCYASLGQFAEARPWFERAVAAKEKGDVHGRVDSESLGKSLHEMGYSYSRPGQFAEARPWLERAVAAAERGDVHGRVDSQSLGVSLHEVGYCHASLGQFAEARMWFERAAAAAEKGDVHGRLDSRSLGQSLHEMGYCYSKLGQFAEARRWFARAAAAKANGDLHRQVDSESMGRSLHQVGYCHASLGQLVEARPWFERAIAAKEQGDVHGRVNAASLASTRNALNAVLEKLAVRPDA